MDAATQSVQARLHLKDYFAATEDPPINTQRGHAPRTPTNIETLANGVQHLLATHGHGNIFQETPT